MLVSTPDWTDVPKLKGANANKQAEALANRTEIIKSAVLSYPDYTSASAAAATLPDGQVVDVDSEQRSYKVFSGVLEVVSPTNGYFMRGAKGDGISDDRLALLDALQRAAGRTVLLESGKIYRMGDALEYAGDVSLACRGAAPAVIYADSQSFNLAQFSSPHPVISKTLASSQQIGSRSWVLNDTAGVTPGMLMRVISSVDWYFDPRGVTKKSELHRVMLAVGNVVYTEAPAGDGYGVPDETVTIEFITPIKFNCENVVFRMEKSPAGIGATTKTGLSVFDAYEPKLINVSTENCQYTGRFLSGCYRPMVLGGNACGSNAYETGYGVQFYGCSFGIVRDVFGSECRRVVDISGGVVVSRHNLIECCEALGGGFNSEGTEYGWSGTSTGAYQAGFGSHGAADWTIYRNNKTHKLFNAFTVRGGNEVIENNQHFGRTRNGFIDASFGNNLTVRGNKVFADYLGKNTTIYDGGGNINARRADLFIRLQATFGGGRLQICDNFAEVQGEFIQVADPSLFTAALLAIRDNEVIFATSSGTTEVYLINNTGAATTVDWRPRNNNLRRATGSGAIKLTNNLTLTAGNNLQSGEIVSGRWTPTISDVVGFTSTAVPGQWTYTRNGSVVTCFGSLVLRGPADGACSLSLSIPVDTTFAANGDASGSAVVRTTNAAYDASGAVFAASLTNKVLLYMVTPADVNLPVSVSFSYVLS